MGSVLEIQTEVLPGGKIQVEAPDLRVGEQVTLRIERTEAPPAPGRTILDVLEEIHARIPAGDPDEMDRRWREERDAWDR